MDKQGIHTRKQGRHHFLFIAMTRKRREDPCKRKVRKEQGKSQHSPPGIDASKHPTCAQPHEATGEDRASQCGQERPVRLAVIAGSPHIKVPFSVTTAKKVARLYMRLFMQFAHHKIQGDEGQDVPECYFKPHDSVVML